MERRAAVLAVTLSLAITACSEPQPTAVSAIAESAPSSLSLSTAQAFPEVIPLPVNPEGIAVGNGATFWVGNLVGGGIWRGSLRTGAVTQIYADARPTLGLKYDKRSGYLFAARGVAGWATVIDGGSGATIADLQLVSGGPTFINDVIVTRTAAYFTDSFRPVLYRVKLGHAGGLIGGFEIVPLSGDFQQVAPFGPAPATCTGIPGPLSANGIEATRALDGGARDEDGEGAPSASGTWLIINNLARGELYRVDPISGDARKIDLHGDDVCLADGNLLHGRTLYVMQNLLGRMAVVRLSEDYLSGKIERYIVGAVPMTTMARFGNSIYAVTAGFPFLPASQPHQVVRFDR